MTDWIETSKKLPPRDKVVLVWAKLDIDFYTSRYSGEKRERLEKLEGVYMGKLIRPSKLIHWDGTPAKPKEWALYDTCYHHHWVVTHWMPLPSRPK